MLRGRRRTLSILAALTFLVAGGTLTAVLVIGTSTSGPVAVGIVSTETHRYAAHAAGEILGIAVEPGDRVRAGELLFTLILTDYIETNRAFRSHLGELQGWIDASRRGAVPGAIDPAQACRAEVALLREGMSALDACIEALGDRANEAREFWSLPAEDAPETREMEQRMEAHALRYKQIIELAAVGGVVSEDIGRAERQLKGARSAWADTWSRQEAARKRAWDLAEFTDHERERIVPIAARLRSEVEALAGTCRPLRLDRGDRALRVFLEAAHRATETLLTLVAVQELRSPWAGEVLEVHATVGDEIEAAAPLVTLRTGDLLWVDAWFPPDVDLYTLSGTLLIQKVGDNDLYPVILDRESVDTARPPEALVEVVPGIGDSLHARLEFVSRKGLTFGDVVCLWKTSPRTSGQGPSPPPEGRGPDHPPRPESGR